MNTPILQQTQHITRQPGYQELTSIKTPAEPAWYNPVTGWISSGERSIADPYWGNKVINARMYSQLKKEIKAGKLKPEEIEKAFSPQFLGKIQEFEWIWNQYKNEDNKEPYDYLMQNGVMSGGILRREEFMSLKTVRAAANIIAATPQAHVLMDAVTVQGTQDFDIKVFDWTGFDIINENIDDMQVPVSGRGAFGSQTFSLKKYGWTISFSEEFMMETYDVPVRDYHITNMAGQLDQVKNQRVADILMAISGTAASDWTAMTGAVSTNNPSTAIDSAITTIYNTNKGQAQNFISGRGAYNALIGNSYMTGVQYSGQYVGIAQYTYGNMRVNNVPRFAGLNMFVDDMISSGSFIIIDPQAILFADGPSRTNDFRNDQTGVQGTVSKAWFGAKNLIPTLTARLTGVGA